MREDVTDIFSDAEVVVVVDDWKADTGRFLRSPTYFAGRMLHATDPLGVQLCNLLRSSGASAWHASGARAKHPFLFNSSVFEDILELLSSAHTCLYDMLASTDSFQTPAIRTQWRRILDAHPQLAPVWDVQSPHAVSLFRFVEFLGARLARELPSGSRVLVVVDRLDWLSSRSACLPQVAPGLARLGWGERRVSLELVCVLDKTASGSTPYLPLLGLVDSEVWALGRLNGLKLPDGTTIRDRYLRWQASGHPSGASVVSEEEFEEAFKPHAQHKELRAYWNALKLWPGTRRVTLKERDVTTGAV